MPSVTRLLAGPRRAPALVAALLACTPTDPPPPRAAPHVPAPSAPTRSLALPELGLHVPAEFVELEPDRVARLRDSALREAPDAAITLAGARAPDGLMRGMVYVQHSVLPRDPATDPLSVRQALARMGDDLRARVAAVDPGLGDVSLEERGDGLEGCFALVMRRDDRSVETRTCTRIEIPDDAHARVRVASCMADTAHVAAVCAPILASLAYTPAPALPLDHQLPANAAATP
jgi:hypothetical protein